MYKKSFFECLCRKGSEFEPEFMRLLEIRNGWQREKPAKTGFYYVRTVAPPR